MTLYEAAKILIDNVMSKHQLTSIEELECPDMRALAKALNEEGNPLTAFQKPYGEVHTEIRFVR